MKFNIKKDIFLEEMRLIQRPGWDILEEDSFVAFKSPVAVSLIDFVYGNPSMLAFEKAKKFYHGKPFTWLLSEGQDENLLALCGFTGPQSTFEMTMNLSTYTIHDVHMPIEIKVVQTRADFSTWINVVAQWLYISVELADQFFSTWVQPDRYVAYLGYWLGEPVATALVDCGGCGAVLYYIGTLPAFRCRGVGTALTHACLEAAKLNNRPFAVLYGSEMGRHIYEKIGFRNLQTIRRYSYKHE